MALTRETFSTCLIFLFTLWKEPKSKLIWCVKLKTGGVFLNSLWQNILNTGLMKTFNVFGLATYLFQKQQIWSVFEKKLILRVATKRDKLSVRAVWRLFKENFAWVTGGGGGGWGRIGERQQVVVCWIENEKSEVN